MFCHESSQNASPWYKAVMLDSLPATTRAAANFIVVGHGAPPMTQVFLKLGTYSTSTTMPGSPLMKIINQYPALEGSMETQRLELPSSTSWDLRPPPAKDQTYGPIVNVCMLKTNTGLLSYSN
ncbi:hypothetical protein NUW54_g62 [Trametes sanguinea]|uniref:Uncharacterized protein n=1 Tax=Trametes sanguinea TaxID=158606 RepID=A0ACC1QAU3_9APHY|nr:hypothetical protein NUW54_g62 [Trametes sanguinea]